MKTTFHTSAAVALLGMISSASAAPATCEFNSAAPFTLFYNINVENVSDIPGWCGGFWDNLKLKDFHGACLGVSKPNCWESEPGKMTIQFHNVQGCTPGHVHTAWWEATKDELGPLQCCQLGETEEQCAESAWGH